MRVKLSYEEQILNALAHLPRVKGENVIARGLREYSAIRSVLQPLHDEIERLQAQAAAADRELAALSTDKQTLMTAVDACRARVAELELRGAAAHGGTPFICPDCGSVPGVDETPHEHLVAHRTDRGATSSRGAWRARVAGLNPNPECRECRAWFSQSTWAQYADRRMRHAALNLSELARRSRVGRARLTVALRGLNEAEVSRIEAVLAGKDVKP